MTDYFALLGQPRRPWLDLAEVKKSYHAHIRESHPDVATSGSATSAELNEAYRVLSSDSLRLRHLLELTSRPTEQLLPERIQPFFSEVGEVANQGKRVFDRLPINAGELQRSLLRADILNLLQKVDRVVDKLTDLQSICSNEVRELDSRWDPDSREAIAATSELQQTFSYLERWLDQLRELRFRIDSFATGSSYFPSS